MRSSNAGHPLLRVMTADRFQEDFQITFVLRLGRRGFSGERGDLANEKIRQQRSRGVRDRAGHLVYRPRRSQERGRRTAPRHRSRHEPHRHRRDVWRRRTGGRRSDRRQARRGFSGLEGAAEQRLAARHHRRLRAFAGAAEDRSARLLSAALARILSAARKPSRRSTNWWPPAKSARWGVSNFDTDDLNELLAVAGKGKIACNQVLYHLQERAIEHAVIPWCEQHGVAVVAYSPFGHNDFPSPRSKAGEVLQSIADAHGASPRQVALAFLTRRPSVFAIPKAVDRRSMPPTTPRPAN